MIKSIFRTSAVLLAISLTMPAWAQMGRGNDSLGSGGARIGTASEVMPGITSFVPSGVASSASIPDGPLPSRMPLTTLEDTPLEFGAAASLSGVAGASGTSTIGGQAHGDAAEKWPYTIARVAVTGAIGPSPSTPQTPVTSRPYRLAGKLYMRFGSTWYVCTASLIKPSILVTAAHCVHNYGQGAAGFADQVLWYPAHLKSRATGGGPFADFGTVEMWVPTPYVNGTDTCTAAAPGIVCNNDIAVLALGLRQGKQAGIILGGWYDYGWNGYSMISSPAFGNHTVGALTQLGYPSAIDNGYQMLIGNSFGKYITAAGSNGKQLRNLQLGSAMTGGSSGGPWLVNFGTAPTVTGSAFLGNQNNRNVVMGVTSWGYNNVRLNVQGASWFGQNAEFPNADYGGRGAGNIGALVNAACTTYPGRC